MKKGLALLLSGIMAVSMLVGCGATSEPSTATSSDSAATTARGKLNLQPHSNEFFHRTVSSFFLWR
jgi:hypothetical protein